MGKLTLCNQSWKYEFLVGLNAFCIRRWPWAHGGRDKMLGLECEMFPYKVLCLNILSQVWVGLKVMDAWLEEVGQERWALRWWMPG